MHSAYRREVRIISQIIVEDNEKKEKALKRFKRMVEKEGIIREWKRREYYEKPSAIRNREKKALERKLQKKTRRSQEGRY